MADKVFIVMREVSVKGGDAASAVLDAFTDPEAAKSYEREVGLMQDALARASVVLPGGQELSMRDALALLGIAGFRQSISSMEVRGSNLTVATPRVVLTGPG